MHGWEIKLAWTVVSAIVGRLVWAFMRGVFRVDPAIWLTRRLRATHPRRWAEVVRWGVITSAAAAVAAVIWGVPAALNAIGPHYGDPAISYIAVAHVTVHPRDPKSDQPFFLTLFETTAASESVPNECAYAWFMTPTEPISDRIISQILANMEKRLDVVNVKNCEPRASGVPSGTIYLTNIYAEDSYVPDNYIKQVQSNDRYLYFFVVWRYRIAGHKTIYSQEFCTFWHGDLDAAHICPGAHNRAFVYAAN